MENSKKEKEVKADLIKMLQSTLVTDLQNTINDLEDVIKQKNDVIDELNNKVFDLQTSKEELANMLADSKEYAASLEATIDTYYSSWWHRIFG